MEAAEAINEAINPEHDSDRVAEPKGYSVEEAAKVLEERDPSPDYIEDGEALELEENEPNNAPSVPNSHPAQYQLAQHYQQLQAEIAQYERDIQSVNWEELRREDPGEYAALHAELGIRRQNLQVRAAEIQNAGQSIQDQQAQAFAQQQHAHLQAQERQLLNAIPTWRDQGVRSRESAQLRKYLHDQGYTDSEINSLSDWRSVKLVRDAMLNKQKARKKKFPDLKPRSRTSSGREDHSRLTKYERDTIRDNPHSVEAITYRLMARERS